MPNKYGNKEMIDLPEKASPIEKMMECLISWLLTEKQKPYWIVDDWNEFVETVYPDLDSQGDIDAGRAMEKF